MISLMVYLILLFGFYRFLEFYLMCFGSLTTNSIGGSPTHYTHSLVSSHSASLSECHSHNKAGRVMCSLPGQQALDGIEMDFIRLIFLSIQNQF